jgi:hypothetical protein
MKPGAFWTPVLTLGRAQRGRTTHQVETLADLAIYKNPRILSVSNSKKDKEHFLKNI